MDINQIKLSVKSLKVIGVISAAFALVLSQLAVTPARAALGTAPVTLTVQYETTGDRPEEEWHAVVAAFTKKYPNVTVNFSAITNEAKGGPNLQVLSSDGAPDIALLPLNSNVYTQMVKAKALVPLNGIFKADDTVKRIGPPAAALKQADGNYYATPHTVVYYNVLWTNPTAIAKAKATLPKDGRFKSVADLVTFSKACSKAGYAGLAIGGKTNFQASWMFDAMMPSAVSDEALNNYINSYKPDVAVTSKWTDKGIIKTLDALGTLAKSGVYQAGYLGMDLDQATAYFTAGKSCMLLGGTWMPGGAFQSDTEKGTMKFTPGFATLPSIEPGKYSTVTPYYGDAYGIPIKSKNQEWALELLRYFISDEGQTIGALNAAGNLPAVTTIPKSAYTKVPQGVKDVLTHVQKYGAKSGWTSEVPGAYGQTFLNPLIQKLQEGKTTSADIAKAMQTNLEAVRKNGL
jgi:raffinose/stachyose/melibiose transport system substrate-binding protein